MMTGTWMIGETRKFADLLYGKTNTDEIKSSLNSLHDRLEYARYHYKEVTRLLEDYSSTELKDTSLLIVAHSRDDKKREAHQDFMVSIGAHSLACVQSIHVLGDILAYACFQTLGYGLPEKPDLKPQQINLESVQKLLNKNPTHVCIATLLERLEANTNYKHVTSISNRSKHQSIVKLSLNEDWTGKRVERHEVRFSAFTFKGIDYPESEIGSVLNSAFELASITTVQIGNEIHLLLNQKLVEGK